MHLWVYGDNVSESVHLHQFMAIHRHINSDILYPADHLVICVAYILSTSLFFPLEQSTFYKLG